MEERGNGRSERYVCMYMYFSTVRLISLLIQVGIDFEIKLCSMELPQQKRRTRRLLYKIWYPFSTQCHHADENNHEAFDKFAVVVMDKIMARLIQLQRYASSQREMKWSKFHQIQTSELPKLWNELCTTVRVLAKHFADPMLAQYVWEKLFERNCENKSWNW